MVNIEADQLIAAINPDLYYDGNVKEMKKLVAQKGPYNAVKEMIYKGKGVKSKTYKFAQNIEDFAINKEGVAGTRQIVYDSAVDTLEPIYFWLTDFLGDLGLKAEKLVDNFTSSPGSGHFAELGQRASVMQQQGSKMLADINTVLRSILNIIYDLKEFKIRLQSYEDLKSDDKTKSEGALLSLKQIWMDKVDIQKGNSSIKAMALGQAGFQTLLDAFLAVKDESLSYQGKEIDLNERVKRILLPRVHEFNTWLGHSEEELTKRYKLERAYLKSQVNSLKLYSRWAKPYLQAASQLETMYVGRNPALVKTFNTIYLQLDLFGSATIDIPPEAGKNTIKRKYYRCVLINFKFRGIPQKVAQQSHYAFGGRTEIIFRSFALNQDEIKWLKQELDKSDLGEMLDLIHGTTDESLETLQEEIDYFIKEEKIEQGKIKTETKKVVDTSNPFKALFGGYRDKPKEQEQSSNEIKEIKLVKSDNWLEKTYARPEAALKAEQAAFKIYDVYKKTHDMASFT